MNVWSRTLTCGVLLLACSCGSGQRTIEYLGRAEIPPSGEGFSLAVEQVVAHQMKGGHEVELSDNGEVFALMEREISRAKSSVNILLYIWKAGDPSDRILRALSARARGVECRVLVDGWGSRKFEEALKPQLEKMGCEARVFKTLGGDRDFESRTHRKIVVIDGKVGITGGFGIDRDWLGDGLSEHEWRDQHVLVRGPAVRDMQLAFVENWLEAGGMLLPLTAFAEDEDSKTGSRATFIASSPEGGITYGERLTQVIVASARKRIWIANAYFVPPTGVVEKLIEKKRAGVDVRILVPGEIHDIPPVLIAQRGGYKRLLEAGVRVFEYQPSMMHAKTMVLDDQVALIGSNNLDPYSLEKLEEGSLLVEDARINQGLAKRFEEDLTHSKEMSLDSSELKFLLFKRAIRRVMWTLGRR